MRRSELLKSGCFGEICGFGRPGQYIFSEISALTGYDFEKTGGCLLIIVTSLCALWPMWFFAMNDGCMGERGSTDNFKNIKVL